MKKIVILALIILFAASTLSAYAGVEKIFQGPANCISKIGGKSAESGAAVAGDTIFQSTSKNLDDLTSYLKGEKSTYTGTPTGFFQSAKDMVEETVQASPKTRAMSLRGNPGEVARRRGIR